MRILLVYVLVSLSSLLNAQAVTVTVNNGYGSGTYRKGDTIHIWSRATIDDSIFVNWTGDIKYLVVNDEWHTSLLVPKNITKSNFVINANYTVLPNNAHEGKTSFMLKGINKNGAMVNKKKPVWYHFPQNPKGVVFLFHGTGGSGERFYKSFERNQLTKDLVAAGYGTIAFDCNQRSMDIVPKSNVQWSALKGDLATTNNNIDILNTKLVKDSVINLMKLSADIPIFSMGMSAGASFGDLCAAVLKFNAHAHMTSHGNKRVFLRKDLTPIIWIMAEYDHLSKGVSSTEKKVNFEKLKKFQNTEWYDFKRSPFNKERFMRSYNGITAKLSLKILNNMKKDGYVDAKNNYLLSYFEELPKDYIKNMNLGFTVDQRREVSVQMKCVIADHMQHSDYNKTIIRFFDKYLLSTSVKEIGQKYELRVYPNPTNGFLTINNAIGEKTIDVYSTNGVLVDSIKTTKKMINIVELKPGVYFLRIKQGNNSTFRKILKI